jgi:predicted O-methyltransferase YrrM
MEYYKLVPEDKEKIKEILLDKNTEKDPTFTKKYLNTMLEYRAVFTPDGEYRRLHSHTRIDEHDHFRKALKNTKAKQTLEVGFAYGSSALVFAEHHQKMKNTGISHTIIDPNQFGNQDGHWEGIGVENLKRCGFIKGKNYRLIENTSVLALPELYKKFGSGWLDVALIDGWHLFDYTLLDIFYCLEMVRDGGYVIVDDKSQKSVNAVSKYITRSYSHVVDICPSCKSSLILRKKSKDKREWNSDNFVNYNLE